MSMPLNNILVGPAAIPAYGAGVGMLGAEALADKLKLGDKNSIRAAYAGGLGGAVLDVSRARQTVHAEGVRGVVL